LPELELRANQLLDKLLKDHLGRRVLTVSHGALIRVLLRIVSRGEFPRDGERLGNACLSIFVHEEGEWKVLSYEPRTLHPDLNVR
jgi:broad specificity phosphatase PhoE